LIELKFFIKVNIKYTDSFRAALPSQSLDHTHIHTHNHFTAL